MGLWRCFLPEGHYRSLQSSLQSRMDKEGGDMIIAQFKILLGNFDAILGVCKPKTDLFPLKMLLLCHCFPATTLVTWNIKLYLTVLRQRVTQGYGGPARIHYASIGFVPSTENLPLMVYGMPRDITGIPKGE